MIYTDEVANKLSAAWILSEVHHRIGFIIYILRNTQQKAMS